MLRSWAGADGLPSLASYPLSDVESTTVLFACLLGTMRDTILVASVRPMSACDGNVNHFTVMPCRRGGCKDCPLPLPLTHSATTLVDCAPSNIFYDRMPRPSPLGRHPSPGSTHWEPFPFFL